MYFKNEKQTDNNHIISSSISSLGPEFRGISPYPAHGLEQLE